ncbi:TPA: hypothetical protein N3288_000222 [Klebsiella aerogenes]|nr:hypothetical protein [Klebsiella aerogenes]
MEISEKGKPHRFKAGAEWKGNRKGRPKGSKSAYYKSRSLTEAETDLKSLKRMFRAILNNDLDTLAEFGITKVSTANKLDASRQLEKLASAEIKAETARLIEEGNAIASKQAKQEAPKATFSSSASLVPIKKVG